MRKSFFFPIVCATILSMYGMPTLAQVRQKGLVLLQNSGRKPLSQVTILVSGAVPATSDSEGGFSLHFATRKEGDAVRTIDVSKTGYELVNAKDVELWNISQTATFLVVMCPKGSLEESRRKYYKLGEDRYQRLYRQKLKELDRAIAEQKLQEADYQARLEEANRQLQQAMQRLDEFCDKFARINRDMLSELDKQAMALLDKGDIDAAIKVYEDAHLLETFKAKSAARDSLQQEKAFVGEKISEEIRLLEQEGSRKSLQRSDSLKRLLNEAAE